MGLAPVLVERIFEVIVEINQQGTTVLLVEQNALMALEIAHRGYVLGTGKVALADTAEALRFFDAMKALHIASWARRRQRHAFGAPYFERFHRALISRVFAAGSIQLLRVAVAGRDVGYLYNFRQDGRIYAYQSGLDDADRKRRPGVLSHAMAIRFNALNGDKIYDFLAGENQLKASFADSTYPIAWQVVRLPRLKYRLESAARHLKQRLLG